MRVRYLPGGQMPAGQKQNPGLRARHRNRQTAAIPCSCTWEILIRVALRPGKDGLQIWGAPAPGWEEQGRLAPGPTITWDGKKFSRAFFQHPRQSHCAGRQSGRSVAM
jgi:hypothetical protein